MRWSLHYASTLASQLKWHIQHSKKRSNHLADPDTLQRLPQRTPGLRGQLRTSRRLQRTGRTSDARAWDANRRHGDLCSSPPTESGQPGWTLERIASFVTTYTSATPPPPQENQNCQSCEAQWLPVQSLQGDCDGRPLCIVRSVFNDCLLSDTTPTGQTFLETILLSVNGKPTNQPP